MENDSVLKVLARGASIAVLETRQVGRPAFCGLTGYGGQSALSRIGRRLTVRLAEPRATVHARRRDGAGPGAGVTHRPAPDASAGPATVEAVFEKRWSASLAWSYRAVMVAGSFEDLVDEAWNADREGWDFSRLAGRVERAPLLWDYRWRAAQLVREAQALLDVDTGGGELLAALAPLPGRSVAVEGWGPNLHVARRRLSPLGVRVEDRIGAAAEGGHRFDLVLSRHGRLDAVAFASLLVPGGRLLTQQVGSRNHLELNELIGGAR